MATCLGVIQATGDMCAHDTNNGSSCAHEISKGGMCGGKWWGDMCFTDLRGKTCRRSYSQNSARAWHEGMACLTVLKNGYPA